MVPLLQASLEPASQRAVFIRDSPAGLIIHGVVLRDAEAETSQGTVYLASGVVMVLEWMVRALASQNGDGDARALARSLARTYRDGEQGRHVADLLDHLLDGTNGTDVIASLLTGDQESLFTLILQLADLAATQAKVLALTGGTDMDGLWEQIGEGLRGRR